MVNFYATAVNCVLLVYLFQLGGAVGDVGPHRRRHRPNPPLDVPEGPSLNGLAKLLNGTTYTYLANLIGLPVLSSLKANATLFLPTNEAFQKQLKSDVMRKAPADIRRLLQYHIVRGIFDREDLNDEITLRSYAKKADDETGLIRSTFYDFLDPPVRLIGHAELTDKSARAVGGMIHVISAVLRPPSGNIIETLSSTGRFRRFANLIRRSNMTELLSCDPNIPFTVLAPNDEAFGKLSKREMVQLQNPGNLKKVVMRHIINLTFYSRGINDGIQMKTLGDDIITFHRKKKRIRVSWEDLTGRVVELDTTSTNGVIHEINRIFFTK